MVKAMIGWTIGIVIGSILSLSFAKIDIILCNLFLLLPMGYTAIYMLEKRNA